MLSNSQDRNLGRALQQSSPESRPCSPTAKTGIPASKTEIPALLSNSQDRNPGLQDRNSGIQDRNPGLALRPCSESRPCSPTACSFQDWASGSPRFQQVRRRDDGAPARSNVLIERVAEATAHQITHALPGDAAAFRRPGRRLEAAAPRNVFECGGILVDPLVAILFGPPSRIVRHCGAARKEMSSPAHLLAARHCRAHDVRSRVPRRAGLGRTHDRRLSLQPLPGVLLNRPQIVVCAGPRSNRDVHLAPASRLRQQVGDGLATCTVALAACTPHPLV